MNASFGKIIEAAFPKVVETTVQKILSTQQHCAVTGVAGVPDSPQAEHVADECKVPLANEPVPQKSAAVTISEKKAVIEEESPVLASAHPPGLADIVHLQRLKVKSLNGQYGSISEQRADNRWGVTLLKTGEIKSVHEKNLAVLRPSDIDQLDLNYWEEVNLDVAKEELTAKHGCNFFNILNRDALSVEDEFLKSFPQLIVPLV